MILHDEELRRAAGFSVGFGWRPADATDEERHTARVACSGLNGRFADCTFASFHAANLGQAAVRSACETFARDFAKGQWGAPWLIGRVGTGKTHLAAAVVNHVVHERGMWARLTTAREIVRDLRSTWGKASAHTEEQVVNDFAGYQLLVLDEVGAAFDSDAERTQLFEIIDRRYVMQLPTMLLSNLNVPAIKAALGDRSYDRLREGADIYTCTWTSHRTGGRLMAQADGEAQ